MGGNCVPRADAVCQKSERCCEEPACNRGDSSKLEIEQWPLPSLDPISWRTMLCSWHFSTTHKRQSRASTAIRCARCDILVPSALKCAGEKTSPCIASNDLLTAKDLWCGHNHLVANGSTPRTGYWGCTLSASVLETLWAAVICLSLSSQMDFFLNYLKLLWIIWDIVLSSLQGF